MDPDPKPPTDAVTMRVIDACRAMVDRGGPIPLDDLATEAACSTRTLTRSFHAVVGVTPYEFGQAVRAGRARTLLRTERSVTDAIFAAGYESTRGFYEEVPPTLGMAPRTYRDGGPTGSMRWTRRDTPVGSVLLAASDRGLAAVRIGPSADPLVDEIRAEFPRARLVRDDRGLEDAGLAVAAIARGAAPPTTVPLDLHGTAFQARVWDALRRIPAGRTRTYSEVAASIGRPTSVRAVANACAANPAALIVPCHRVVRADGGLGGYRWGIEVKRRLLEAERG